MSEESCSDAHQPDLSALSEEERARVLMVLQKAKEFEMAEEKSLMRQSLEGLLCKYTNVMKGWQNRWFSLDPDAGILQYFEREEYKNQKARGFLNLAGAVISPSDEDSQTFIINAINGEVYRLRANDAKERQLWVNRLRATSERHSEILGKQLQPAQTTRPQSFNQSQLRFDKGSADSLQSAHYHSNSHHNNRANHITIPRNDKFREVKDMINQVQKEEEELCAKLESLPAGGEELNALDKDVLVMKATCKSTLHCLEQCLTILQKQQPCVSHASHSNHDLLHRPSVNHSVTSLPAAAAAPSGAKIDWLDPAAASSACSAISAPVSPADSFAAINVHVDTSRDGETRTVQPISHEGEVEDEKEYTDTDLDGVEEHKSIILHLLSQLKLGMDLTKVVLPTFILEKRSLLEMFADCMAHPDIFLRITDNDGPEERMLAVVEWYLTSFHAGRKGAVAKKPYNPIIGEHFHCSWRVPSAANESGDCDRSMKSQSGDCEMFYCAEQVSHHPPISAFYFECPKKQMYMNASIWTKSKFMGMSIGVSMIGKVHLHLLEHDEEYTFSLPSAYARSILTVPWVELGDKISVACRKSGCSANVVFHTKPFYGGKLHRVTAEMKNKAGDTYARVQGEWNGQLEFSQNGRPNTVTDTSSLTTVKKRVRPLEIQEVSESRRLWHGVTDNLQKGEIEAATKHKHLLEERQRKGERHRKESGASFPTKFFHLENDAWSFNAPLEAGQIESRAALST